MHISEGVIAAPVLIAGAAGAVAGCAVGLKKMDLENTPKVAVLSSAFFVASLIHIPVGPTSVHLVLTGLVGILLGWMSFPALLVALFLQAVLLQFGGITTLGVNTLVMAAPALLCYILFAQFVRGRNNAVAAVAGFLAGATGILLGGMIVALFLISTGEQFITVAKLFVVVHLPVMIVEGILTAFVVTFIRRIKPDVLGGVMYEKY
ncbi:MAG: cobalt transporter CbiM [candidate division WOR-3 bacterium]|nr:MAG: cobalt transporter CbiM [candidate division WOR-3 bacterium]